MPYKAGVKESSLNKPKYNHNYTSVNSNVTVRRSTPLRDIQKSKSENRLLLSKVLPRTGHEGPEGSRGIAILFFNPGTM
jgi:hypothetical protein